MKQNKWLWAGGVLLLAAAAVLLLRGGCEVK